MSGTMVIECDLATFVRIILVPFCLFVSTRTWAATGGSISDTVKDQSGGVIPGAALTLTNLDLATSCKSTTDPQGLYSFSSLPVGRYELTIEAAGFKTQKEKGILLDTDVAVREPAITRA